MDTTTLLARMAELRLHIVTNERARAFYSRNPARESIRIRHCTQRITAARTELDALVVVAEERIAAIEALRAANEIEIQALQAQV